MDDSSPVKGYIKRMFFNKKFLHYTWISVLISSLNVFFLWLFIDVFLWGTVFSSVLVVGGNFIFRYVLLDLAKV